MTMAMERNLYTTADILSMAKMIVAGNTDDRTSFNTKMKNGLAFLFDSSHESALGLPADMQAKMYLD